MNKVVKKRKLETMSPVLRDIKGEGKEADKLSRTFD